MYQLRLFETYLISCNNQINFVGFEIPNDGAIPQGINPIKLSFSIRVGKIKFTENLHTFNLDICDFTLDQFMHYHSTANFK